MFQLTEADRTALAMADADYLNAKGAKLYAEENYAAAVEYYRLAAAMGSAVAMSNLGYCYLYGRAMESNLSIAFAYFSLAVLRGDVDAAYKLGDIYGSDRWGIRDDELSIYYYRLAMNLVLGEGWEASPSFFDREELRQYPSLCYAMGREYLYGEVLPKDVAVACRLLELAEKGYEAEIANGKEMYAESLRQVREWLKRFSE